MGSDKVTQDVMWWKIMCIRLKNGNTFSILRDRQMYKLGDNEHIMPP